MTRYRDDSITESFWALGTIKPITAYGFRPANMPVYLYAQVP